MFTPSLYKCSPFYLFILVSENIINPVIEILGADLVPSQLQVQVVHGLKGGFSPVTFLIMFGYQKCYVCIDKLRTSSVTILLHTLL